MYTGEASHFGHHAVFRALQVESLRKDIEILSQNHERDVDRKDAIIQMLDRDLEEVRKYDIEAPR